ncbi:MAG: flagellar FliJ family protein [Lachnospiraceae bacterium]|nr:flagellar FliJ family protein [Lachnospiraceae bacterium]MBP3569820.1 flagellar FliJ family protein [Lachnospiraceae bacterium]
MAKFVYKMQSLLNIKEKLEDQAKTAFGLAKAVLNEEEEKLAEFLRKKNLYIEQKRETMASISPNMSEGSSVRQQLISLNQLENAIKTMELRIAEQILVVRQAEKNVQLAQAKLENAMKERKIQEKLREHALEEFLKEMEAADQQEINELVTFRFGKAKEREN